MSKKELVKSVIDGLISQGKDFHEITQGTLAQIDELSNISKTTIKRAKNEYKKEKIVVKSNYKETLIKRKIYKHLDRYPKTTLSELREALPEITPSKVSEYHLFWTRKREKTEQEKVQKKVTVNPRKLKEMVFHFLNGNEDTTCEQLLKVFPDANKSSVTSYYGHWKKKRASHEKGKEGSLYQVIFRFLDNHKKAAISDLKDSFPDVPTKSLEVYLNLWQKKQKESHELKTGPKTGANKLLESGKFKGNRDVPARIIRKNARSVNPTAEQPDRDKETEKSTRRVRKKRKKSLPVIRKQSSNDESILIAKLRKTIEKQKITLTALEVEHSILKDNIPAKLIDDLDSMSDQELRNVREFVKTYVKGLNT